MWIIKIALISNVNHVQDLPRLVCQIPFIKEDITPCHVQEDSLHELSLWSILLGFPSEQMTQPELLTLSRTAWDLNRQEGMLYYGKWRKMATSGLSLFVR